MVVDRSGGGTRCGKTEDFMMVVLLEPGITGGRTFAAFRAVSNIRTGCGGTFLMSSLVDGIVVEVEEVVGEEVVSLLLLEHRRATQRLLSV
jgi:hypothetical protein